MSRWATDIWSNTFRQGYLRLAWVAEAKTAVRFELVKSRSCGIQTVANALLIVERHVAFSTSPYI